MIALGLYRHYKGGLYAALAVAETHEHNGDMDVVYAPLKNWRPVTRPLRCDSRSQDSWTDEVVWPDGQRRARFTLVMEAPSVLSAMGHEFSDWARGLAGLTHIGESLEAKGVTVKMDLPATVGGHWFMDMTFNGKGVVVEWHSASGYGVSSLPGEGYGMTAPDFAFKDSEEALKKASELLGVP